MQTHFGEKEIAGEMVYMPYLINNQFETTINLLYSIRRLAKEDNSSSERDNSPYGDEEIEKMREIAEALRGLMLDGRR